LGGGYGGNEFANDAEVALPVVTEGYAFAETNEGRPAPVFDQGDTWQELHFIRNHQMTMFAKGKITQRYGKRTLAQLSLRIIGRRMEIACATRALSGGL
jgi:hypothetical protein